MRQCLLPICDSPIYIIAQIIKASHIERIKPIVLMRLALLFLQFVTKRHRLLLVFHSIGIIFLQCKAEGIIIERSNIVFIYFPKQFFAHIQGLLGISAPLNYLSFVHALFALIMQGLRLGRRLGVNGHGKG